MDNIILIGMPGAGKSTVGVLLAKTLGMQFIDTDIALQEVSGRLLQEMIDEDGPEAFLALEEQTLLSLRVQNTVIATGGSAVYSRQAMEHLSRNATVVYLKISFEEMEKRLNNITTRGIVLVAGQSLRDMYTRRVPLYEQYADITIDCSGDGFENIVEKIVGEIKNRNGHRSLR